MQDPIRHGDLTQIVKFGAYGNYDDQGAGSKNPKPEISLGWPCMVAAGEDYIYVGDQLNCRIVRVDKTWKSAAECEVK